MKAIATTILLLLFFCQTPLVLAQQNNDTLETEPSLKRGLYFSFEELFNNNPSITDSFYLSKTERKTKNWEGTYSYTPHYPESKKKIKKLVGFCDGEKRYIFFNEEFFELDKNGREYSFWSYGNSKAIYVIVVEGRTYNYIMSREEMKNIKANYVLEQSNNKIYSRDSYELVGVELAIYRKKRKEKEEAINIVVNDSLEFNMLPNSYYSLIFKRSDTEVKICVEKDEDCFFIKPDTITTKYVKISQLKTDEVIKIEEIEKGQGEYETVVPYKKQKRRNSAVKVNFGTF